MEFNMSKIMIGDIARMYEMIRVVISSQRFSSC